MKANLIELERLAQLIMDMPGDRLVVGLAGAPGSGKSTLAEQLAATINAAVTGEAAILPMDGFHYDDILLNAMGRRAHKGAPDTFDVGGLAHIIRRLKENTESAVAVPVFDRDIEIARAGARLIPKSARCVIVEGNYLLLKAQPWGQLKPLFDFTVMVAASEGVLRKRLVDRWAGYGLPPDEIRRKVEENDLPNGRFVAAESNEADFVLAN